MKKMSLFVLYNSLFFTFLLFKKRSWKGSDSAPQIVEYMKQNYPPDFNYADFAKGKNNHMKH